MLTRADMSVRDGLVPERVDIEKPRRSGAFGGADERARTVDLLHGKQTLYQLSYIREGAEYSRRLGVPHSATTASAR